MVYAHIMKGWARRLHWQQDRNATSKCLLLQLHIQNKHILRHPAVSRVNVLPTHTHEQWDFTKKIWSFFSKNTFLLKKQPFPLTDRILCFVIFQWITVLTCYIWPESQISEQWISPLYFGDPKTMKPSWRSVIAMSYAIWFLNATQI